MENVNLIQNLKNANVYLFFLLKFKTISSSFFPPTTTVISIKFSKKKKKKRKLIFHPSFQQRWRKGNAKGIFILLEPKPITIFFFKAFTITFKMYTVRLTLFSLLVVVIVCRRLCIPLFCCIVLLLIVCISYFEFNSHSLYIFILARIEI